MVGVSIDALIHYQKRHKVWRKNSMDKKGITYMKIIIPVMAAIVIIGGAIVYFTKQPKAQEVMAPIETEQDIVEDKAEEAAVESDSTATIEDTTAKLEEDTLSPEETSEKSEQITESEQTTIDDGINSTHTDVELTNDEYQGDEATDGANINLNEEEQAAVNRIEENLKKKHPEWFTDTAPSTSEGNYEHVGTPDNGELPTYNFGESGHVEGGENMTAY